MDLFEKYADVIDLYADVTADECETILHMLEQHEETIMIVQYIRQKGFEQGMQQGRREGLLEAIELGLQLKFGTKGLTLMPRISGIQDIIRLKVMKDALPTVQALPEFLALIDQTPLQSTPDA